MGDYEPYRIDGGWRCRRAATCYVDVLTMGLNLRLVLSDLDDSRMYGRAWCYRPNKSVLLRAHTFDPDDPASEPEGWIKQVGTNRRPCKSLHLSPAKLHHAYVAACPYCGDESLG